MAADNKLKRKKKRWHSIMGRKPFESKDLGESYVSEPDSLLGRKLTLNLMTLLNNPRKQNINITFKIDDIKEGKALASVTGFEMIPSSLKRLVRRGKDKIEDSFTAKTKNGQIIRIKPVIITQANTYHSEQTRLRLTAREQIKEYASKEDFESLIQDLIDTKIQKSLRESLGKLYPLKAAEIRVLKLVEANDSE